MLFASDVDSIDPGVTYSNTGQMLAVATQRSLLTYAPGDVSAPLPDLAAAAPVVSPDGLSVTVALKPGVRFSPPVSREVTSRDVKYAIERGFFRSVRTPYAQLYFSGITGARPDVPPGTTIPGIETPDDRTIVFHLDRPNAGTLIAAMVMTLTAPVPAEYAAQFDAQPRSTYGTHQVATGPYMIRTDAQGNLVGYRAGRRIDIVRNPNWDPATDFRPARLDAIVIRSGNTNFVRASRRILRGSSMLSGDIFVPVNELRRQFRSRRDQFAVAPAGSIQFMPLNTKLAPFDDINVRRAVLAGFDRVSFRRIAGGPLTGDIATHFIPPTVPGFAEAGGRAGPGVDFVSDLDGSRALAAHYLRRAGFRSGRYTGRRPINVLTAKDTTGRRVGRFVAGQLRRLGFRDVRPLRQSARARPRVSAVRVDPGLPRRAERPRPAVQRAEHPA
jgi:peptide/nickel transport system substrate-binding protein